MEKIKCEKRVEKDGRYFMGYVVPIGQNVRSSIIMIAGYTQAETEQKLAVAISEMPPKYQAKYEIV